jgi:nicotinamide mononucleotide transporter
LLRANKDTLECPLLQPGKQVSNNFPPFILCCHICIMNILEIAGFLFGVAGVFLTLKENVWCFPVGLINVIISLFLFYNQKLYADSLQQTVYIVLLTYGWFIWLHGENKKAPVVSRMNSGLLLRCLFVWFAGTAILGFLLDNYTDAATPWPDSAATVLSFIAQYLVARKKIENWLLWIVVNIAYVSIYIYKDLMLYAVLFGIYLLLAVAGYVSWKKQLTHGA